MKTRKPGCPFGQNQLPLRAKDGRVCGTLVTPGLPPDESQAELVRSAGNPLPGASPASPISTLAEVPVTGLSSETLDAVMKTKQALLLILVALAAVLVYAGPASAQLARFEMLSSLPFAENRPTQETLP